MRMLMITLTVLALVGCATADQRNASKWDEQRQSCLSRFDNDSRIEPIRQKISATADQITLIEQSQTDFATEAEKPAILAFEESRKNCMRGIIALAGQLSRNPEIVRIFQTAATSTSDTVLLLYQGRVSFGEFAVIRKKISDRMQEQLAIAESIERTSRIQAAAVDTSSHDLMELGARLMNPRPAVPPSTHTSCTQFGNTMNCTTR